jgi:hypothetical protein
LESLHVAPSPVLAGLFVFRILVDFPHVGSCARDAIRIVGKGNWEGESVDLIEGFLGLVAAIVFLACLGRIGDSLQALEKRERDH